MTRWRRIHPWRYERQAGVFLLVAVAYNGALRWSWEVRVGRKYSAMVLAHGGQTVDDTLPTARAAKLAAESGARLLLGAAMGVLGEAAMAAHEEGA